MTTTDTTATEADFTRHAQNLAAGFAALSPAPARRFTNPNPQPAPPTEAVEATAAPESTDARVLREAGIVGKMDLRWHGMASIEHLTGDLLTKKEKLRLGELQAALDRLAAEIATAAQAPLNPVKIANAAPIGEMPSTEAMSTGIAGDDGRLFRKRTAKAAAMRFFDQECRPVALEIYSKAAAILEAAILDRRKIEEEVHEKHAEIFHDEIGVAYKPSPGLIRMMSRRRMLLDAEIPHASPPSLRSALSGIVAF